jgi:type 1 glutamine amidotransferase
VYSALGHDAASFAVPAHGRLVAQAAAWAARLI